MSFVKRQPKTVCASDEWMIDEEELEQDRVYQQPKSAAHNSEIIVVHHL